MLADRNGQLEFEVGKLRVINNYIKKGLISCLG